MIYLRSKRRYVVPSTINEKTWIDDSTKGTIQITIHAEEKLGGGEGGKCVHLA